MLIRTYAVVVLIRTYAVVVLIRTYAVVVLIRTYAVVVLIRTYAVVVLIRTYAVVVLIRTCVVACTDTRTCSELKKLGLEESCDAQLYTGTGDPIWVKCDLDDENGVGVTVIGGSRDATAIYTQCLKCR